MCHVPLNVFVHHPFTHFVRPPTALASDARRPVKLRRRRASQRRASAATWVGGGAGGGGLEKKHIEKNMNKRKDIRLKTGNVQ